MAENIRNRIKKAWNAFKNQEEKSSYNSNGYYYRPDRPRLSRGNEKSIVTSIYNRIAIDCSEINIYHARLDSENRFLSIIDSSLNNCLTLEANIDQTSKAFIRDLILSMFDEGVVAIVPVDTSYDPLETSGFDVETMRVGKIIEWFPKDVRINVYNENKGIHETIIMPKKNVCIIENPLYSIINEPNSTMKRLIRKLNLLDLIDEQSSSGKLDLIIQLPYVLKGELRKTQAEERRKEIEEQLNGSKYGIAYTDGTEHITQLNRPAENNIMKQIEYLTELLNSQLGITTSIMDGSADEKTMLNYYNRTIEPIMSAIVDEIKRKFLSKTARTQKQSIVYFRDPFKLVPVNDLATIADRFTRNEILSSNEVRQIIGRKPSTDPNADVLRNKNISNNTIQNVENVPVEGERQKIEDMDINYNNSISGLDEIDNRLKELEENMNG